MSDHTRFREVIAEVAADIRDYIIEQSSLPMSPSSDRVWMPPPTDPPGPQLRVVDLSTKFIIVTPEAS